MKTLTRTLRAPETLCDTARHGSVTPLRIMGIRHGGGRGGVLRLPLLGAAGALGQLPLVTEQGLEVTVVPLDGLGGPGALDAAADGVGALAGAEAVLPAQALLLNARRLRFAADILARIGRTVGLAEGVAARGEGYGLFVVHGHAREGLPDVPARSHGVRIAVGALRIHVDEAHLDGAEGVRELTVAPVALVTEPLGLRTPVNLVGLPDVRAPAGETEGLESHRIDRHVAGENHQIGPGDLSAILLLDRPEQPACLVEAHVVGPAVEGGEALGASAAAAAATIRDPVGARAVPGHANEEGAVVAVARGPPVLRIRHEGMRVLDHGVGWVGIRTSRVRAHAGSIEHAVSMEATDEGPSARSKLC